MSSRIPCAHSRWTWRPSSRRRETFYWHVTMKLGAQVAKLGIAAVLKTASRKGAQVRILPWASNPRFNAHSALPEGDADPQRPRLRREAPARPRADRGVRPLPRGEAGDFRLRPVVSCERARSGEDPPVRIGPEEDRRDVGARVPRSDERGVGA